MAGGASGSAQGALSCNRCKSKVVNATKYQICGSSYHPKCAKIVSNNPLLDSALFNCCGDSSSSDDDAAFFDAVELLSGPDKKIDISIFNYIVKQKDLIIAELRDRIKLLSEQVTVLSKDESVPLSQDDKKTKTDKNSAKILQPIMTDNTQLHTEEVVNDSKRYLSKKTVPVPRKNKSLIIGNGPSFSSETGDDFAIARVVKRSSLHVTRVNPNISEDQIKTFVEDKFQSLSLQIDNIKPNIKLLKLSSRYPESYSSFKVTIDSIYVKTLLDSNFWPKGVAVRKYFNTSSKSQNFQTLPQDGTSMT